MQQGRSHHAEVVHKGSGAVKMVQQRERRDPLRDGCRESRPRTVHPEREYENGVE